MLLGLLRGLLTPYGLIFLTKAALFAALMMLAALDKWRFGPDLASGNQPALAGFRATVTAE